MLLLGSPDRTLRDIEWFAAVFSQKLDQILRQRALTEGDRKQGRERSLLYSIINAVSDPILLTDTEGRLLIANARALTSCLFEHVLDEERAPEVDGSDGQHEQQRQYERELDQCSTALAAA